MTENTTAPQRKSKEHSTFTRCLSCERQVRIGRRRLAISGKIVKFIIRKTGKKSTFLRGDRMLQWRRNQKQSKIFYLSSASLIIDSSFRMDWKHKHKFVNSKIIAFSENPCHAPPPIKAIIIITTTTKPHTHPFQIVARYRHYPFLSLDWRLSQRS